MQDWPQKCLYRDDKLSPRWAWSRLHDVFIFLANKCQYLKNSAIHRYTYNGRLIGNSIWPIKWQQRSDVEWPWRSFIGCRSFQLQAVKHLCSILHNFNWQCISRASCRCNYLTPLQLPFQWQRQLVSACPWTVATLFKISVIILV